jgi:hypothetical protein
VVTLLSVATIRRVATNRQRLNKCKLFEVQLRGWVEFLGADQEVFAEPAVNHHADDIERRAAVAVAFATRKTLAAVHIGFNATLIANFNVANPLANFNDFHTEFVTNDQRILKERHFSEVSAVVRAANAHSMRAYEDLPRTGCGRSGNIHVGKLFWFFELNCFHGSVATFLHLQANDSLNVLRQTVS